MLWFIPPKYYNNFIHVCLHKGAWYQIVLSLLLYLAAWKASPRIIENRKEKKYNLTYSDNEKKKKSWSVVVLDTLL